MVKHFRRYTILIRHQSSQASFKPSAKIKNAGSKNIDEDVGEEKKEVVKEEELEGYVPGEFLDDPRDAADMEEEAMRLAEQNAPVIKPVVDNHFEKLQVELMAQIESEHKQMVEDADLKPSAEEGFEEETGYTVQGAPTGEFDSAIEEGERYESKLEAESERMRKELVDRREREVRHCNCNERSDEH